MKIKVDHHSDIPVYKQIVTAIKDMILAGELIEGKSLPSVRKLAISLGVNPNTVAKVFFVLQSEGYVDSKPGIGYYVAKPSPSSIEKRLIDLDDEMRRIIIKMKRFALSEEDINKRFSAILEGVFENEHDRS